MDDLTNLTDLSEATLLDVLRRRYENDLIYTCIGDIIIATNPYKTLPMYGEQIKQEYKNIKIREERKPHIYIISDRAYQNLKWNNINQCCVVSGESGAGKTESTKLLIEHTAFLCRHNGSHLNDQIVEVNPLLEAFGNAQTVINNNSSRFGKFIELIFDKTGQLEGAKIDEYLLEKSRVIFHAPGEKNFHIFYYFFAGVEPERRRANRLQAPEKHRIMMNQDGGPTYESEEWKQECKETWFKICEVMQHVGFRTEEIQGIEALLTAIIHISDITFIQDQETEGVSIKDDEAASLCAELLGVNAEKLVDSLIIFKNKVGNEDLISLKNETQAGDGRDALAKALYGRLFVWIVRRINHLLAPKSSVRNRKDSSNWIGILDIYGFENFQRNSFEQLCINIANEQLQLFFNQHIFQMELAEYEKEGVPGNAIKFVDNKPLLDLFFKSRDPPGILAILDEESKFPQSSDQTFTNKLVKNFTGHPGFQSTKGQSMFFTIKHFAGPVLYNAEGFLEKNRDTLSDNISECLGESESLILYELFSPLSDINIELEMTGRKKRQRFSKMINNFESVRSQRVNSTNQMKRASFLSSRNPSEASNIGMSSLRRVPKTLATHFSGSLHKLTEQMINAEPHFIRCIKPNRRKEANNFSDDMVLEQLNYTGVLETIKIRKQGYPTRLMFPEFVHRYGLIIGILPTNFASKDQSVPSVDNCRKILELSRLNNWQIGKSKIFLKHWHIDKLNSALTNAMETILACQKYWRGVLARTKLGSLKAKALTYRQAFAEMNLEATDIGERFYNGLQQSLDHDKKSAEAIDAEKPEYEEIDKNVSNKLKHPGSSSVAQFSAQQTIRIRETDRAAARPSFPSIWESVKDAPQSDPCFVFLRESIMKINMLQRDIWCKLYLMEKNAIIGKLYIRDNNVTLNDSQESYTGKVIGIHSKDFEHLKLPQCQGALKKIEKGIVISKDTEGNIFITRISDVEVNLLGENRTRLTSAKSKIFDIEEFKEKVASHLKSKEAQSGKIDVCQLARLSVFNFSLGEAFSKEVDTPLWVSIINIQAFDLFGQEKVLHDMVSKGLTPAEIKKVETQWSQLDFMRK